MAAAFLTAFFATFFTAFLAVFLAAAFLATFFTAFFAVFLAAFFGAAFFATFFTAFFAVFFTAFFAVFLATFLAAGFLATFFAAFLAVAFLATFFTAFFAAFLAGLFFATFFIAMSWLLVIGTCCQLPRLARRGSRTRAGPAARGARGDGVDARTRKMRADTKEPASVNEAGSWMSARAEMKVRRTPLRFEAMAMAALAASTWFVLALDNSVDPLFSRNLITVFFTVNR